MHCRGFSWILSPKDPGAPQAALLGSFFLRRGLARCRRGGRKWAVFVQKKEWMTMRRSFVLGVAASLVVAGLNLMATRDASAGHGGCGGGGCGSYSSGGCGG